MEYGIGDFICFNFEGEELEGKIVDVLFDPLEFAVKIESDHLEGMFISEEDIIGKI